MKILPIDRLIQLGLLLLIPNALFAGSCGEQFARCAALTNHCDRATCAKQALDYDYCPDRADHVYMVYQYELGLCNQNQAQRRQEGNVRSSDWGKNTWNNTIQQIGDVADKIQNRSTSHERNQALLQSSRNIAWGMHRWRNGITIGSAGIAGVALWSLSWPWLIGGAAVSGVIGYFSPDMFGVVTERMFGG